MNKEQKARLQGICEALSALRDEVGEEQEKEQEKYDNMPEGLLDTDQAERFLESADALGSAMEWIEEAITSIESALGE